MGTCPRVHNEGLTQIMSADRAAAEWGKWARGDASDRRD